MTKKNILAVLFVGFIFVAGVAYWQSPDFENEIHGAAIAQNLIEQDITLPEESESSPRQIISENKLVPSEERTEFSEQDKRDIEKWHGGGITATTFNESDYALYDEATLLDMANSGHTMAMKALWFRYLTEDRPEYAQKRNELATKAIIYGDREMFIHMPEYVNAQDRVLAQNITSEERRLAQIETLAYSEFMGLRGSLDMKYNKQKVFFSVYSKPDAPIQLTEADKDAVRLRAQEIYDGYEQKRIELGLGPFDNSIPDGMKKLFEIHKRAYLEEMGDNAI